jgi:type I restriction enzyme, S subunit
MYQMGDTMSRNLRVPPSVKPGIPKLGFKPKGWREVTFKDILEVIVRRAEVKPNERYQLINAKRNRGGIVPRASVLGKQIKTATQFFVAANDFVISRRQIVHGACGIVPPELDGALVSNEYSTLVPRDELLLPYLGYYAHTTHFQQTCFNSSVGVVIEKMVFNLDHWLRHRLYLPPLEYQRDVVNVLATTDRAIAGKEKLIAAKRMLMKGLAHQLLAGQRRLSGFSKPWSTHRIDTISTIAKGAGITKEDVQPDGLPAVRYGELYTTYDVQITKVRSFISPEAAQAAKPIRRGDLLLAGSGEDRIEIGKAATYMGDEVAYAGGDVIIVSPTDANSVFLAYLFDGEHTRRHFYRRAQGESIVHIYMRDVGNLELELPPRGEQDQIAIILNTADREIALLIKELAALRELKKGLMQKLLNDSSRSTWGQP